MAILPTLEIDKGKRFIFNYMETFIDKDLGHKRLAQIQIQCHSCKTTTTTILGLVINADNKHNAFTNLINEVSLMESESGQTNPRYNPRRMQL
ncbi:hypothetical protein V6N13_009244 [Hibiscus sabdariffa]